jgi:hypothetical protein
MRVRPRRVRAALAASLILTIAAATTSAATAAPPGASAVTLPGGWSFDGRELSWASPLPLRIGGARYEFRDGDVTIGIPTQDEDVLRLAVAAPPVAPSVWAAGRRLDTAAPTRREIPPPPDEPVAAATSDPAGVGPYAAGRRSYVLEGLAVAGYPAPIEVVGEVTEPMGRGGVAPLVLLLHGRHSTCYRGGRTGESSGDWPCPAGWKPVPSQTGYRYIADVLASQGYLVVSIAANGVNGQDAFLDDGGASARSQLVRHHLGLWASWTRDGGDPWGSRFRGKVRLDEVVLVGHSRGGEGVARAAIDSDPDDPWTIAGLVLVGPTAFGRQVPPGVHTTVILPFCDGDVADLQGQQYVDGVAGASAVDGDDGALRTSVVALGANHNYFNTEWTPGLSRSPAWDDWFAPDDPRCGDRRGERLTPTEQQAVGLAYVAALVDLAVDDDPAALPLLDGGRVRPATIGRASTRVHATGAAKPLLYAPGSGARVRARGLSARECVGYEVLDPFSIVSGCDERWFELLPHWSPTFTAETAPPPVALEIRWRRDGGSVTVPLTGSTAGADALDLRIAGDPGSAPTTLRVRLRDASGRSADVTVRPATLWPYWGQSPLDKVLAKQFRVALPTGRLDRDRIVSIELLPSGAADRLWLFDVSARRPALPTARPAFPPRVSAGRVTVDEGDGGGARVVDVPITIERPLPAGSAPAQVWVQLTDYSSPDPRIGFPLTIPPGATSLSVPVTIRSDGAYSPYAQSVQVTLLAGPGAVTGEYTGRVDVVEDDPAPTLTVDAPTAVAYEGGELVWTFRLSDGVDAELFWAVQVVAPDGRFAELDTDDLPVVWFEQFGIPRPDPAIPLSQADLWLWIQFLPDQTETTLTLPIGIDEASEPEEGVALVLEGFDDPVVAEPIELVGMVPSH